ncbi:SURF1 family protein [Sphingomonas sp. MMS12-HWE2-04]|uniref:SURF1 family protein n=1 Tax=Sphingomonas sp. MMS12-HWE2-04 TaxID=3234199 RepID=UPI00384D85C0
MKRVPIFATLLVALAVAAMLGLGVWQLQRRGEKEAALTLYAANLGKPAIPFPSPPIGDTLLFRRAHAMCVEPLGWRKQGGRSIKGLKGWRQIVECRTGAEGPGLLVDMGVSPDPGFVPHWAGGRVTGTITHAPDHRPLIASAFGGSGPKPLMLVSDMAAPGLEPTARPDLSSVPNNHLAYAVQWFLFAGVALVIYGLALRWRARA